MASCIIILIFSVCSMCIAMGIDIFSTNDTTNIVIAIVSILAFGISTIMISKIEDDARDEIQKLSNEIKKLKIRLKELESEQK